ncbi:MAG: hypothetical protein JO218_17190 [Burkholderiales bacterium]|nr:hypothetical protein [Burkholderiales bacterium]
MFDCLDTFHSAAKLPSAQKAATPSPAALARQYAGRNWVRFQARDNGHSALAKVREIALYLNAKVERTSDDSIVLLDLSLTEILALSDRFGDALGVEAHISTAKAH